MFGAMTAIAENLEILGRVGTAGRSVGQMVGCEGPYRAVVPFVVPF